METILGVIGLVIFIVIIRAYKAEIQREELDNWDDFSY